MWFVIAILGYLLLALVFVLDKFILTKTTVIKPSVYTFYSTIFLFGALLAWPFGVELLRGSDWIWAIVSGLAFGFGLWTLYVAVKRGEASHVNPYNGAIVTVGTLFLSLIFLGEELTAAQMAGVLVLVVASVLLSFQKTRSGGNHLLPLLWAFASGILFAISHVAAKYIYGAYPFLTGFVWTRASIGLVGLVTLMMPSVRRAMVHKNSKKHSFVVIVIDKVLAIAAIVLIQYAMAISSVTLVAAMSGLQYVIMFVLIYSLTRLAPRIFQEYFTKRELMAQTAAIVLVAVGSAMFVL